MAKYIYTIFILVSFWQPPDAFSQGNFPEHTSPRTDSLLQVSGADRLQWYERKGFQTLAVPAVLIGYGLSAFGNQGFPYSSQEAYVDRNRYFPGFRTGIDDFSWAVPAVAVYGLNAMGVKGKHTFTDRTLLYLFSTAIANGVSLSLKESTQRIRPDQSNTHSFPSGHTTNAFVAAEFLHQEYKHKNIWYSIAGYSIATATGAMRVLNNEHWLTDVFVGAGIGMLSTKVVYVVYPFIEQKVKIGKGKNNKMSILPVYSGQVLGVVMVYSIM